MALRPSPSLICRPMTKVFDSYTGCDTLTASKTCTEGVCTFSAACEACACVWCLTLSVNTNCALCVYILKCLFLCTSLCYVCACYVCVCLSVANYPSYKYKIPIRHWVSGWLQRRHNWFQMVTQIFLSLLQRHHTACVWEKAAGESEVERGKKRWVTGVNKYRASTGINKQTLNVSFVLKFSSACEWWAGRERRIWLVNSISAHGFETGVFILMWFIKIRRGWDTGYLGPMWSKCWHICYPLWMHVEIQNHIFSAHASNTKMA